MNLADARQNEFDPTSLHGDAAIQLEHECRSRISMWWGRAGLTESYPAADGEVVRLLQGVEYVIANESLARFLIDGQFGGIAIIEGRRNWSATDVVRLASFLESRRDWLPGSTLHAAKRTSYETALENHRAVGLQHPLFHDLDRFDLKSLLLLMTEADSRQMREALYVGIQLKLESYLITL